MSSRALVLRFASDMALSVKARSYQINRCRYVQPFVAKRTRRVTRAGALGLESVDAPASTTELAVYLGLGATLLSFVVTFGVIPQFQSSFKEPDTWQEIYAGLLEMGGVPAVSPAEAAARAQAGCATARASLNSEMIAPAMPVPRALPPARTRLRPHGSAHTSPKPRRCCKQGTPPGGGCAGRR